MTQPKTKRSFLARLKAFADLSGAIGLGAALAFSRYSRRTLQANRTPYPLHPKQLLYPIFIRPNTSDIDVFCQIFLEQEYLCLQGLKDVEFIIDCGANVGYASAYFLSRFPNSKVIAVEADHDNYEAARTNLQPYGDRVTLLHAGVWSHRTGLELRSDSYRDGRQSTRQVQESELGKPGSIEGVDIPYLLKLSGENKISLLKIDIEGAEAEVFSPTSTSKEWLPLVQAMVIELHDDSSFGPCSELFHHAIGEQHFHLSQSGELTVCLRSPLAAQRQKSFVAA